jgi:hypothetical protein
MNTFITCARRNGTISDDDAAAHVLRSVKVLPSGMRSLALQWQAPDPEATSVRRVHRMLK